MKKLTMIVALIMLTYSGMNIYAQEDELLTADGSDWKKYSESEKLGIIGGWVLGTTHVQKLAEKYILAFSHSENEISPDEDSLSHDTYLFNLIEKYKSDQEKLKAIKTLYNKYLMKQIFEKVQFSYSYYSDILESIDELYQVSNNKRIPLIYAFDYVSSYLADEPEENLKRILKLGKKIGIKNAEEKSHNVGPR